MKPVWRGLCRISVALERLDDDFASVMHSVLLYGAPTWAHTLDLVPGNVKLLRKPNLVHGRYTLLKLADLKPHDRRERYPPPDYIA